MDTFRVKIASIALALDKRHLHGHSLFLQFCQYLAGVYCIKHVKLT